MVRTLSRLAVAAAAVLLLAGAGFTGWKLVRADVESRVYRERLARLAEQHHALTQHYNTAVRRTAVTELIVENDQLCVLVRTADGPIALFDTPFDPAAEIFVDFVIHDGRLLTRRVYDDATAPRDGFVIDERFTRATPTDTTTSRHHGKTVYRSLSDGRWLVEVTGNGSLALRRSGDLPEGGIDALRAGAQANADLVHAPQVTTYDEWTAPPTSEESTITASDLWHALFAD